MKILARTLNVLVFIIAGLFVCWWLWNYYVYAPWTRDARVRAEVITLATDVSGWVIEMPVHDQQNVEEGQLLMKIDSDRYKIAMEEAKAKVETSKAQLQQKEFQAARRSRLTNQAISMEDRQNAQIDAEISRSEYNQNIANLAEAELNLRRSYFYSPLSGTITSVTLTEGNYANSGDSIMALIVRGSYFIEAYFEETKLQQIAPGQPVTIQMMTGNIMLTGRVKSIGRGITIKNTEQGDEMLPEVDPTFNWVRLAQRIPVHIEVDWPQDFPVSVGMTATVSVNTGEPETAFGRHIREWLW